MGADQYLNLILLFTILFILLNFTLSKPKNLPPGPKAFPIIGHLHLIKRPMHRFMDSLSEKYGDVVFLRFGARKVVVVSSPEAVEECFTKNDIIFAYRNDPVSGKLLNYNCTTIGLSPYGDCWRNLRRIAAVEFLSQHRLSMFTNIRHEEVHFMLKEIYEDQSHDITKPTKVNLRSKFWDLTLNKVLGPYTQYYDENDRRKAVLWEGRDEPGGKRLSRSDTADAGISWGCQSRRLYSNI